MYVPLVKYPGTWLSFPVADPDATRHIESLLYEMTKSLGDAAIAQEWFEHAQASRNPHDEWARAAAIRQEASDLIRSGSGSHHSDWERESIETDELAIRLASERGIWPRGYGSRFAFIHAHTFLYSLDAIAKSLGVLAKRTDSPSGVATALDDWNRIFPTVKAIRDSAHHMEDRARGLGRREKPLNLQPIDNQLVSAPGGGVLINSSLMNNRFGTTTESGHYEEVEVDVNSLAAAQAVVQKTIDAFDWRGPAHLEPSP
ncbi:hypothetical protein ACNPNP_19630 [Microbacterium sp. AGC85]